MYLQRMTRPSADASAFSAIAHPTRRAVLDLLPRAPAQRK